MAEEETQEEFTVLKRTSNIRHNEDIKAAIQSVGKKSNSSSNNDKNVSISKNSLELNKNINNMENSKKGNKLQNPNIQLKKMSSSNGILNATDLVQAVRSASMTNSENKKKCRAANAHCISTGVRADIGDRGKNLDGGVIEVFRSFRLIYFYIFFLIFLFRFPYPLHLSSDVLFSNFFIVVYSTIPFFILFFFISLLLSTSF